MKAIAVSCGALAAAAGLSVTFSAGEARADCSGPSVTITGQGNTANYCGYRRTVAGADINIFQGIRYATAERFAASSPAYASGTDLDATNFGAICPQSASYREETYIVGEEDCLYLNVWAPVDVDDETPVMVFIHGGAFVFGSSADGSITVVPDVEDGDHDGHTASIATAAQGGTYDGSGFASKGVVLVSLNYRLGALGFVASSDPDTPIPANLGLLDQQLALKWVQEHIHEFGGNPNKVTLFGESAGAMSTGLHMLGGNTTSEGLFHAAIMESNPMGYYYKDVDQADEEAADFLSCAQNVIDGNVDPFSDNPLKRSCKVASKTTPDMADITAPENFEKVMMAQLAFGFSEVKHLIGAMLVPGALPYAPVVDAENGLGGPMSLTIQPLGFEKNLRNVDKNYIFGVNHDEGALFADAINSVISDIFPVEVNTLTPYTYGLVISTIFPAYAESIYDFPNGADDRKDNPYSAQHASPWGVMNDATAATSNVINDFAFRCGNLYSAGQTTRQGVKAWGYVFQPDGLPFQVMGADLPACNADNPDGLICHTEELPFVFDTFGSSFEGPTEKGVEAAKFDPAKLPANMAKLSQDLQTAWADFAKEGDPTLSVFKNWTPYAGSSQTVALMTSSATPGNVDMIDLGGQANCAGLWNGVIEEPDGPPN